jgi:hypothetical protein
MMDKVQKYNSFNTNTPSSESYRNYSSQRLALCSVLSHYNTEFTCDIMNAFRLIVVTPEMGDRPIARPLILQSTVEPRTHIRALSGFRTHDPKPSSGPRPYAPLDRKGTRKDLTLSYKFKT